MNDLIKQLRKFREDRNWQKYHTPKNLSMALVKEVSELVEIYQWQNPVTGENFRDYRKADIESEVADIFIYLLNFCDVTGIDLLAVTQEKIRKNAVKYPK